MRKTRQRERLRRWFSGVLILGLVGSLTACTSPGGEGCGGIEDLVSCLSVTNISPTSTAGGETSNVDVVQDICSVDATTGAVEAEPFTDHNAAVTFSNDLFPGASSGLGVTITDVRIVYTLNDCPVGAVCPPLPEFSQGIGLVVPTGETATATLPLVPLRVKRAYVDQGGSTTAFPSYDAQYIFTAQTQGFSDSITADSRVAFTVGNFDLCP